MDWYYPVLGGVLTVSAGKARLAEGWDTFVMEGLGVRCVSDEPWVTASETAECALAFAAIGDFDTAADLLRWTGGHRRRRRRLLDRASSTPSGVDVPRRRAHVVHRGRRHPRRRRHHGDHPGRSPLPRLLTTSPDSSCI